MREDTTLREFLGILLKCWRMLLTGALLCALFLGGSRFYSLKDTIGRASIGEFESQENKENVVYEINNISKQLDQVQADIEDSLIMSLDSDNVRIAYLSFSVFIDDTLNSETVVSLSETILNYYYVLAKNCRLRDIFANTQLNNIDERYLRDLIKLDNNINGVITIQGIETEYLSAEKTVEIIYEYILKKQKEIARSSYSHTLIELDKSVSEGYSQDVNDIQLEKVRKSFDLSIALKKKVDEFENIPETSAQGITTGMVFKSGIKYSILGAAIGLVVAAILVFVGQANNTKITSGSDMARILDCRYLGSLQESKQKKGLDLLAQKLCREDIYASVAKENRLPLLAANLKEAIGDNKTILLTGNQTESQLTDLADKISVQLNNNLTILIGKDLLIHPETVNKLGLSNGVIFVGNEGKTTLEYVALTVKRIEESGKELFGVIWA